MRTTILFTFIVVGLLMAGCKKTEKEEIAKIPTTEQIMGSWTYQTEYHKENGEWKETPRALTVKSQTINFGPDSLFLSGVTFVEKGTMAADYKGWNYDAKTGSIAVGGEDMGRIIDIDENDVMSIFCETNVNPDTGEKLHGEFLNKFKRSLPSNQRFVGKWEYIATFKKSEEQIKNAPIKWDKYDSNGPDEIIIQNTSDGKSTGIVKYNGESSKADSVSYNIDDKTGSYTIDGRYQGRIVFLDNNNVWWYQDKVRDYNSGKVTEGSFYMHLRRTEK